jgi:hypothetical protein
LRHRHEPTPGSVKPKPQPAQGCVP